MRPRMLRLAPSPSAFGRERPLGVFLARAPKTAREARALHRITAGGIPGVRIDIMNTIIATVSAGLIGSGTASRGRWMNCSGAL
jgi:hypothetical protein